jgi:hypothetical protein
LVLAVVLTACSGTESIGSGDETTGGSGGSGGSAGLGSGGTSGTGGTETNGSGGSALSDGSGGLGETGTGGAPADSGIAEGSGGSAGRSCVTRIVATDDNGYKITVDTTVELFTVKPSSELTIDWSGLGHDLAGDPLDPRADIDDVVVGLVNVPAFKVGQQLIEGEVTQSELAILWESRTGESRTVASTFDLAPIGAGMKQSQADLLGYFDAVALPPEANSYFVEVSTGTAVGFGVQAFTVFSLDETSSNTALTLADDTVRITKRTSPPNARDPAVPAGVAGITLDFSQLQQDAEGHAITWQNITKAEVVMTSTDIRAGTRSAVLDASRDHVWRAALNADSVDLGTLTDDAGNGFTGIDKEHGWLLALYEDSLLPVPAYLVELNPNCAN